MHAGETMHCKPCYNSWPVCLEGLLLSPLSVCSSISEHIEAETKWPPFRRWHFQVYFLELKLLIFSCDQAALRTLISVRLSVCLSVRLSVTPFWQCSCHRIILKLSGVITIDRRDVHAKCQGQRSKVKVTEVMTPFSHFWTVTPVWIHIWRWNDAQSLMLLRSGAVLFFKVIRQISRSHS